MFVCVILCAGFEDVRTSCLTLAALFYLHLHVWETEVKVTETKQTAFPLVTSAAAVAFCPGRLGPSPRSAVLLHSVI